MRSSAWTSASRSTAPGIVPASRAQSVDLPMPEVPVTTSNGGRAKGRSLAAIRRAPQHDADRRDQVAPTSAGLTRKRHEPILAHAASVAVANSAVPPQMPRLIPAPRSAQRSP